MIFDISLNQNENFGKPAPLFYFIMKKFLSLILLGVFYFNTANAEVIWNLSKDGTLAISGTGNMENYDYQNNRAPWYSQRESIKNIIIENGIRNIGSYAFCNCTSLTSITIPYSVTNIGCGAFHGCSALTSVTIPNGSTTIDNSSFSDCSATVTKKTELCVEDITSDLEFENGYCDPKGYKGSSTSYKRTQKIPCKAGDIFKTLRYTSYRYITAYSGDVAVSAHGVESVYSYTVPEGVDGIVITIYTNQSTIEKTIIKKSYETISVNAEHILSPKERKARVTIIDDDGYAEFYQYFVPLMRKYGIPICTAYMGDVSPNMADRRYMSKEQLDEVVALGGEVIVHGGNSLTSFATVEEAEENVVLSKTSLKRNGFDSNIYVYPNSGNNVAIREMISRHFDCAIKTASPQKYDSRTNDKCVPHYFIHRSSCGGYYDDKSPLYGNHDTHTMEYFQALVDDCVERKSWLVFMTHVWMMPSACSWRTNPDHANEVYAWKGDGTDLDEFALFEQIIQYILSLKQQGIDIEIVTASEGFNMFRNVYQSGDYLGYWNNDIRETKSYQHLEPGKAINALGEADGFDGNDKECSEILKKLTGNVAVGNGLTSIGDYSFSGCKSLQKVALGEKLATIGNYAFENCSSLTKISIPKNVTAIGDYVFSGCYSLTDVSIEDRTESIYLGSNGSSPLFADCPISTVYLGGKLSYNSSSSSGYSPFYCNKILQSVIIADTEKQIYDKEFYGCTNLISIKIGDGVKSIGNSAFSGCVNLQNISLGKSTQGIGKEAFSNCNNLNSITIPNSVTTIDDMAFNACNNLKNITIYVNQDLSIGLLAFGYTGIEKLMMYGETLPASTNKDWATCNYNTATLYVPSALYNDYHTTSPWSFFKNIVKVSQATNLTDGDTFANAEMRDNQDIVYTRNYTNTKWQALYIPFSMSFNDWKDDFEVAYINSVRQLDIDDDGIIDETTMDIVKITNGSLIPNTPYLIRAKNIGEHTITITDATLHKAEKNSIDCRTTIAEYTFIGTYDTIPASTLIANNYYAMGGGALIMTDGTSSLKPYRWYMKIESRSPMYNINNNAKTITIHVIGKEEETTGIINTQQPSPNIKMYNLNGTMVSEYNLKPGLYIKNGKKVIIK